MKFKIFGDSHSRYFTATKEVKSFLGINDNYCFEVNAIPAASITGFGKRESTLSVSDKIRKSLHLADDDFFLVMAFGQVDVELGYYYKKYVKKESVDFFSYCNNLIDIYSDFLNNLPFEKKRIVCKGINFPTLVYNKTKAVMYTRRIVTENINDDDLIRDTLINMRQSWPSPLERTCFHILFNNMLKKRCDDLGIGYFDINDSLRCGSSGLISPSYVPSGNDHHIVDSLEVRCLHIRSLLESCYLIK